VNKSLVGLIVVGVVGAIAALLFLMPSDTTNVDKPDLTGNTTVEKSDAPAFELVEPEDRPPEGKVVVKVHKTGAPSTEPYVPITEQLGIKREPGVPIDRHAQIDSQIWGGLYRILKRDLGETDLTGRVLAMSTHVAGLSSASEEATVKKVFAEERALLTEVRAASKEPQVAENCNLIEADITAVEAGNVHPADEKFLSGEVK
jgi:hypothetical protein